MRDRVAVAAGACSGAPCVAGTARVTRAMRNGGIHGEVSERSDTKRGLTLDQLRARPRSLTAPWEEVAQLPAPGPIVVRELPLLRMSHPNSAQGFVTRSHNRNQPIQRQGWDRFKQHAAQTRPPTPVVVLEPAP